METIYVAVDDSNVALRFIGERLKGLLPKDEIKLFLRGEDALTFMHQSPKLPRAVFCDISMPHMDGSAFLDLLKRDPKLHFVPVVMVSGDITPEKTETLKKAGAFDAISKPLTRESLQNVVNRIHSNEVDVSLARNLDLSFADDAISRLGRLAEHLACNDEKSVKQLYRAYHGVKGAAYSLQFPTLGAFIHALESVIAEVIRTGSFQNTLIANTLEHANQYLVQQMIRIRDGKLIEVPPTEKIESLLKLVPENHGKPFESRQSQQTAIQASPKIGTVEIPNEKFETLQMQFIKIQQLKNELAQYARELREQFKEESFPSRLSSIAAQIGLESDRIREIFASLKQVPLERLRSFIIQTATQTANQLHKKVKINFKSPENLLVDQSVMETVINAITHLIHNSIDHGIEDGVQRIAAGKPEVGSVKVEFSMRSGDQFKVVIEDDGQGIDLESTRKQLIKRNVFSEQSMKSTTEDDLINSIFIDGFSTREKISEISGRGIGMGAVKEAILRAGGRIALKNTQGLGFRAEIILPRTSRVQRDSNPNV
jgi:chemotaxis protein histidine kinase CheA